MVRIRPVNWRCFSYIQSAHLRLELTPPSVLPSLSRKVHLTDRSVDPISTAARPCSVSKSLSQSTELTEPVEERFGSEGFPNAYANPSRSFALLTASKVNQRALGIAPTRRPLTPTRSPRKRAMVGDGWLGAIKRTPLPFPASA